VDICWESSTCSSSGSLALGGTCHLSYRSGRSHWHREISNDGSVEGGDFERGIHAVVLSLWGMRDRRDN